MSHHGERPGDRLVHGRQRRPPLGAGRPQGAPRGPGPPRRGRADLGAGIGARYGRVGYRFLGNGAALSLAPAPWAPPSATCITAARAPRRERLGVKLDLTSENTGPRSARGRLCPFADLAGRVGCRPTPVCLRGRSRPSSADAIVIGPTAPPTRVLRRTVQANKRGSAPMRVAALLALVQDGSFEPTFSISARPRSPRPPAALLLRFGPKRAGKVDRRSRAGG